MKTVDSLDQIIDLEYFLHQDTLQSPEELHQRDRTIALSLETSETEKPTSSQLLSGWVAARRDDEFAGKPVESPGTIFKTSRSLASTFSGVKGLAAGIITGFAFFAYAGKTPINVLEFLIFFVFSQLLLVTLLFCSLLLRKLLPTVSLPSSSYSLFYSLGKKLFRSLNKQWYSQLPGDKRDAASQAFGIIHRNHQLYGPLFYWPLFAIIQIFGISFNIGLLSSSLLKIITSDLAFGWQSTLQFSSSALERLVHFLATPWSWLLQDATPTLEQIEGSRIILKDGIYHLSTADLVAWWPFLILCLVFYGLMMRLFFYLGARIMEDRTLSTQQFTAPPCLALVRRMRTPIVTTQAAPEEKEDTVEVVLQPTITEETADENIPQTLLIPDDIFDSLGEEQLQQFMGAKGFTIKSRHRFMEGYDEDLALLAILKTMDWDDNSGICIIMEGWMVPLVDFISYLGELRKIAGEKTPIEINLTGKLTDNTISQVRRADMEIWLKKISAIGDPYIDVVAPAGMSQ